MCKCGARKLAVHCWSPFPFPCKVLAECGWDQLNGQAQTLKCFTAASDPMPCSHARWTCLIWFRFSLNYVNIFWGVLVDGRMNGQPEYIMSLAPFGGGGKKVKMREGVRKGGGTHSPLPGRGAAGQSWGSSWCSWWPLTWWSCRRPQTPGLGRSRTPAGTSSCYALPSREPGYNDEKTRKQYANFQSASPISLNSY